MKLMTLKIALLILLIGCFVVQYSTQLVRAASYSNDLPISYTTLRTVFYDTKFLGPEFYKPIREMCEEAYYVPLPVLETEEAFGQFLSTAQGEYFLREKMKRGEVSRMYFAVAVYRLFAKQEVVRQLKLHPTLLKRFRLEIAPFRRDFERFVPREETQSAFALWGIEYESKEF